MSEEPEPRPPQNSYMPPDHRKASRVVGSIFVVVGILVALLSGLCTGCVMISSASSAGNFLDMLPAAALIGGIPFVAGVGLFWVGRVMYRSAAGPERKA